jgi:hypothetical protein
VTSTTNSLSTILASITAKLPTQFQPWVAEYGPAFVTMTTTEFQAWMDLLISGDVYTAYKQLLTKLPDKAAFLATLVANDTAWQTANTNNNASIALQKQALTTLGGILLTVGLAVFGF